MTTNTSALGNGQAIAKNLARIRIHRGILNEDLFAFALVKVLVLLIY
jgi:hypothetical protein